MERLSPYLSALKLNYWMVSSVPRDIQGTFFAARDRINILAVTILSLLASRLLDIFKAQGNDYFGFLTIFLFAIVLSIFDIIIMKKITYHQHLNDREKITGKKLMEVFTRDKQFLKIVGYLCTLSFGSNIALPYYNVYMLSHLQIGYSKIIFLTVLQTFIQILTANFWGGVANRTSWLKIVKITSAVLAFQFLVWIWITKETIFLLPLVFIIAGLISSGYNMSLFNLPYEYIPKKSSATYLSIVTAVVAVSGFLGSVTGAAIISAYKRTDLKLGVIHFQFMQLNFIRGIPFLCSLKVRIYTKCKRHQLKLLSIMEYNAILFKE